MICAGTDCQCQITLTTSRRRLCFMVRRAPTTSGASGRPSAMAAAVWSLLGEMPPSHPRPVAKAEAEIAVGAFAIAHRYPGGIQDTLPAPKLKCAHAAPTVALHHHPPAAGPTESPPQA